MEARDKARKRVWGAGGRDLIRSCAHFLDKLWFALDPKRNIFKRVGLGRLHTRDRRPVTVGNMHSKISHWSKRSRLYEFISH